MENVWTELTGIFGARFRDSLGLTVNNVSQIKDVWARRLSGITREQLKKGFNECERLNFPPSLAEFKTLCLKKDQSNSEERKIFQPDPKVKRSEEGIRKVNEMLEHYKNKILKSMEGI